KVEFVNNGDHFDIAKHDGSLLPILTSYLSPPPQQNRFTILHLMGAHTRYESRYPSDFKRFRPGDIENAPPFAKKPTIAAYLNSLLYGDFILNEIIKHFESLDSIVLFFSDHGEEVYDFRDFIGHADSKISRFMVEIPFIVYVSDVFIQKHPDIYKRLKNAQNQRYMNDDLMHTLLDIAGIHLKGYESKRSLISKDTTLLNQRIRKVGNKEHTKDYDGELKEQ
ncbi:phosphoethanolamine transferase, partial [Helicobacter marmotae]|uniref:phosphoethanolamine transferase n=2 Tax=Helicobacter marmotae TaxID=152490 RepID=UPI0013154AD9